MLLGLKKPDNSFAGAGPEVLTCEQMREADRLAIQQGVTSYALMTAAGQSVANIVHEYYPHHEVLVLCGPGNNGGDGFVAAMFLKGLGHRVTVMSLSSGWRLKGDSRKAYKDWGGKITGFKSLPQMPEETVVIDAVFGTGLSKPLETPVVEVFEAIKHHQWPVVAVDIPSGVNGDTGAVDLHALEASQTVTFFRKKMGHVLMPGMGQCGLVSVHDIGIPSSVLKDTGFVLWENCPILWGNKMPKMKKGGHKYSRGHAVILGGTRMTGAARMASEAAMRAGAGLCTVVASAEAASVYQRGAPHILYETLHGYGDFIHHIQDGRRNVAVMGPGAGLEDTEGLRGAVMAVLATGKPVVLDADALTCFSDVPETLFSALHSKCVLTPHEGEFGRLFADMEGGRLEMAQDAALFTGATIVLKGADTVIAHMGQKSVVNIHATPWLATAGSGDVLAGIIAGLMAQGMPSFEAACAAVWIHGEAGERKGAGLVAPDIIEEIPAVLSDLT